MTRERLEGLPLGALMELSRKENLDFDPEVGREELIENLLEAYEEDQREREKLKNLIIKIEESKFSLLSEDPFPSPDEMPVPVLVDRYDEDDVLLFLRDPTWALAVWEIKKAVQESWGREFAFRGFGLKVLEKETQGSVPLSSFLIPLPQSLGTRYIHLPHPGRWYQVELHALFDRETRLLARSGIVEAPSEGPPYEAQIEMDPQKRRFLELSGLKLCEPYQEALGEEPDTKNGIPQRVGGWDESYFEESR